VTPIDQVNGLMREIIEVSHDCKVVQSRSLRDSGRSLVFSSKGISGSALLSGDRLIHFSAHKRCWGSGRPFVDQVKELIRGREDWEKQGQDLAGRLERAFAKRKKRYRSFKESLAPVVPHSDLEELPDCSEGDNDKLRREDAPLPRPLSAGIHDFFLQLLRH